MEPTETINKESDTDKGKDGCAVIGLVVIMLVVMFLWLYFAVEKYPVHLRRPEIDYKDFYLPFIIPPLIACFLLGVTFRRWYVYVLIIVLAVIIVMIGGPRFKPIIMASFFLSGVLSRILGGFLGSVVRKKRLEYKEYMKRFYK